MYSFSCRNIRITKADGIEIKREPDIISTTLIMLKEELTEDALNKKALDWWDNLIKSEKYKDTEFLDAVPAGKLEYKAPWCLTWFCHQTFDIGLTDEEYLESFYDYVNTTKNQLMGAEDRWRWHGENNDRQNPVCRCEHCKKHGLIRIGH
jgi:hypothetical protein